MHLPMATPAQRLQVIQMQMLSPVMGIGFVMHL